MRFLPQTWAVSSGLHWIQHLPIIQWFYFWVELITPIRKKWRAKKKGIRNLASCSLNVVVWKGVWRECCPWLAGGCWWWKVLGTTLGLSGCLSLWSGDIKWCLDPFPVAKPHICNTQGPAVPYPPKHNVSNRVQLESTWVQLCPKRRIKFYQFPLKPGQQFGWMRDRLVQQVGLLRVAFSA